MYAVQYILASPFSIGTPARHNATIKYVFSLRLSLHHSALQQHPQPSFVRLTSSLNAWLISSGQAGFGSFGNIVVFRG